MKINNVEIYQLDKLNWTYRLYVKKSKRGRPSKNKSEYGWVESRKYYPNVLTTIEHVKDLLINDSVSNIDDPTQVLEVLEVLSKKIYEIINIIL